MPCAVWTVRLQVVTILSTLSCSPGFSEDLPNPQVTLHWMMLLSPPHPLFKGTLWEKWAFWSHYFRILRNSNDRHLLPISQRGFLWGKNYTQLTYNFFFIPFAFPTKKLWSVPRPHEIFLFLGWDVILSLMRYNRNNSHLLSICHMPSTGLTFDVDCLMDSSQQSHSTFYW